MICLAMRTIRSQIKNNPWPYVNLARRVHNERMGDAEVIELLRIANGYLPKVRLEYDRVKNELNTWKAELGNTVRIVRRSKSRIKKERS
jgi:DNA-directed RNA polymerase subunit H (RpoH/RPB5)